MTKETSLKEVKLCSFCNRYYLTKDIHSEVYTICKHYSDGTTDSANSTPGRQIVRTSIFKSECNSRYLSVVCKDCWSKLEDGTGIKDP
jgi:hypothetical protein